MIGIISDIHGNFPALEAVLARLDAMGVSGVVCLGDVAGYYSQVNECCDALRARGIHTLRGNHDHYLAAGVDCPRSNSANRCLEYQRGVVTPDNLAWLAGLSSRAALHGIDMVHGGWDDPLEEYVRPTREYFSRLPGRTFASGHTHVPVIFHGDGQVYCNPGAVGQPRDGDPRATYSTCDGAAIALHRIGYDIARTQAHMAAAGFDRYFYENLEAGSQIGGRISTL